MIFLGLLFQKDQESLLIEKSRSKSVSNQANNFEWSLIDGLIKNEMTDIRIINSLPVGAWPEYGSVILQDEEWEYGGKKHKQIGSVNLPIIKQWHRYRKCLHEIKKTDEKKILIYSAYLPYLKAVFKLDSSYEITVIIPDLPEFYDHAETNRIRKITRKIYSDLTYKYLERVDKFVLLTEQMKTPLKVGNRPYTIVEGICSTEVPALTVPEKSEKKVVFYSGGVHFQYGIRTLLDAFSLLKDPEAELWICGSGDAEKEIIERSRKDSRIHFFGFCSREKVAELRAQASVLVNPRTNEGEYTKYSFPSKTMEYMASGIPVIMYKLDGIPEEYDPFLFYVDENCPNGLQRKLEEVLSITAEDLEAFGMKARDMVLNEKNETVQAAKILKLIFS